MHKLEAEQQHGDRHQVWNDPTRQADGGIHWPDQKSATSAICRCFRNAAIPLSATGRRWVLTSECPLPTQSGPGIRLLMTTFRSKLGGIVLNADERPGTRWSERSDQCGFLMHNFEVATDGKVRAGSQIGGGIRRLAAKPSLPEAVLRDRGQRRPLARAHLVP